jgi:hypothetical protein
MWALFGITFFVLWLLTVPAEPRSSVLGSHAPQSRRKLVSEMHKLVDPPPLNLDGTESYKLVLVYYGYIYPKREHWLDLMRQQLDEFNCNGIARRAERIFVSLAVDTASESNKAAAELVNTTIAAIQAILPTATFDITLENRFEYPGLRRIWDYAQHLTMESDAHNTVFVYSHSKGMFNTYLPHFHAARVPLEIKLFHATFDRWDEALRMFAAHPTLNKAGCFPAEQGHVWFNMFYVRASYVQGLVNPTIAKDRFYYEHWLKFRDNERYWPRVDHIEFVERDVYRPSTTNSGCADCWSSCMGPGNDTLGVTWPPEKLPYGNINDLDWLNCRGPLVVPRRQGAFSTNNYFSEP